MSDDDRPFLARWSARKREAAKEADVAKLDAPVAPAPSPQPVATETSKDVAFDLASLPPLESITAVSDIRAFLAAGVPLELRRAALRRAWTADPAIRDFIGLSENSWDFNAPETIAGFGALKPGDVEKLLAQAIGEPEDTTAESDAKNAASHTDESASQTVSNEAQPTDNVQCTMSGARLAESPTDAPQAASDSNTAPSALSETSVEKPRSSLSRRRHGGALPES
ncbi:MAG: DUF3306 domain-containing protein [Rhizobiales bacterium]|nr:DUF3306 domain-containing protein [Hyphomicrobiales bacterium]